MGHDGGIPELSWVREGSTALGRRRSFVTKWGNGWRWCCCSSAPLGNGSQRRRFKAVYMSESLMLFTGEWWWSWRGEKEILMGLGFLVGAVGKWVTTARSRRCTRRRLGRCSPVMMVLTRRGRLRHFSGFGFLLWERDRAEGEGEMRKREILMGWKWYAGNKTEVVWHSNSCGVHE